MEFLKVTESLKKLSNVYFFPNTGSVGDIFFTSAIYQFLYDEGISYKIFPFYNKKNEKYDLIYGGGGLFNALYKQNYAPVIEFFKDKNIRNAVILPASFHDCDDAVKAFDERFTVFCRDRKSYDYCSGINKKLHFALGHDSAFLMRLGEPPFAQSGSIAAKREQTEEMLLTLAEKKFGGFSRRLRKDYFNAYSSIHSRISSGLKNCIRENPHGLKTAYFLREDSESKTDL